MIFICLWQTPKAGDSTDIVWQKYIWPSACGGAKFSPDGKFIYAAIDSGIVKLNALTGDSISTFEGKHSGLDGFKMDISALGNYIVTESYESKAIIWDCKNEKIFNILSETLGMPISCICIDPLERYVLFGSGDYFAVYDIQTLKKVTSFRCTGISMSWSGQVKFSHDGTKFAIVSWYEENFTKTIKTSVTLWETLTWKKITELYNQEGRQSSSNGELEFSYNDLLLGFVSNSQWKAFVFNLNSNKLINISDTTLPNNYCYNIDFLNDNIHWFYSYGDLNGKVSYDLYNFNKDLVEKKYDIRARNNDYNINSNQLILNGRDWLTLFKPPFTDVSNSDILNENLLIYFQDNKIILELSTIQNGNSQLFISDLNGKNLYHQDLGYVVQENTKYFIDIVLPTGIYLCKVIVGPKVYSKKFEIVR